MAQSEKLFISYGREQEAFSFVCKLKKDLERAGFPCWLDKDDIPAGNDWSLATAECLGSCKAVVCVISSKYIQSR